MRLADGGLGITDGKPPVATNPVAVGVDDTVNFTAYTTTGSDHHEGVPPSLKTETFTISAPDGQISAISGPVGFTPTIAPDKTSATITN